MYQYFCKKLKRVNGVRKIPDDRKTITNWISNLVAAKKRLEDNSNISIENMIDFCMSSYCDIIATKPAVINTKLADLVDKYRLYAANNMKKGRNKLDIAKQVAAGFMKDFPMINRSTQSVVTHDQTLAYTIEKVGGCRKISMMRSSEAEDTIKFAYLEMMKSTPIQKKTIIKSGMNGTLTLKDYR